MLLSDPATAAFIRDNFEPVWVSVRPVPKVTIDFGDGRTVRRTLKGNTVMYVCLPDGRVVDALPGVYTPADFRAELSQSLAVARRLMADGDVRAVRQWHVERARGAIAAERVAVSMSKAVMEAPLLDAIGIPSVDEAPGAFHSTFDAICARLDDASRRPASSRRIGQRIPGTAPASRGQAAVALDSRTNVRHVRPAAHVLLAGYRRLPTPDQCRDAMFKQLLHVPIDDPNLGLGDIVVPGTP